MPHHARMPWRLALALLLVAGCSKAKGPPAATVSRWTAGCAEPAFDPEGPPEPVREALERSLTRALFERDSLGRPRPVAAEGFGWSADSLRLTVHVRPGLHYTDGSPATSADFRTAMLAGLARTDHATRAWMLGAIEGVSAVRAGRALPRIGIEAPDSLTLVLRLARRDPHLLDALAAPGVSAAWKSRTGDWDDAVGLGPYRVLRHESGRGLVLVAADSQLARRAAADTLRVRFVLGAPRVRTLMRQSATDLVWPLPPGLLGERIPAPYEVHRLRADPARRLLLVLRADMPPLTRLPARHALSHALDRRQLLAALGPRGEPVANWLPGAGPFDFPSLDAMLVRAWLQRGKLGGSFHVTLAYDADRSGAEVARALQGQWARAGLYADLRGQRGAAALAEPLRPAAAPVQLVESQAPWPGAAAEMATLVMPLRGPAVGSFRSGWRTREFDEAIVPAAARELDADAAQHRLEEERVALPLADLPWTWVAATGRNPAHFDPANGPDLTRWAPARPPVH